MGNYVQNLTVGVTLIAGDNTWIEGDAIQQLQTTAKLPGMRRVAGMPDLHPGRGYPIGAAFFSTGLLYPALIGGDIGCGMALWVTDLAVGRVSTDKLEQRLGNIDGPLDEEWEDDIRQLSFADTGFQASLGTIGGGNHFAELQKIEEVFDDELIEVLGIRKKNLLLMVHSGSRGYGQAILREHIDAHGHRGLEVNTPDCAAYLTRHDRALRYAEANRHLIAQRILARLRSSGEQVLDVNHNLLSQAVIDGEDGWMHRKGATPADTGLVVIPGSRGDFSYLIQPIPSEESLFSLAHGAGRKWMRGDCKGRLSGRYSMAQLTRTKLGSHVICGDKNLMYEEAPEAYKDVDNIIETLAGAGLIRVIAKLRPVLTYKTRGECCDE